MREWKIGCISDCLQLPFRESMIACSRMGVEGVQIYAVSGEIAPENLTSIQKSAIKSLIRGCGLEISAVCGDLGGHGFAVRKDNPRKIERSKRIMELALELGTNVITTHIGVIPEDTGCEGYEILLDACSQLAEYAKGSGAFFAVETGPEPASRLKTFLDKLPSDRSGGIGVNMDPANLVMVTGDDPATAVRTLGKYIVHTHAKDGIMIQKTDPQIIYDFFAEGGIGDLRLGDYFLETPLGQGSVDFTAYLQALRDIGYKGYLTIEREVGNDPAGDIMLAIGFLSEVTGK